MNVLKLISWASILFFSLSLVYSFNICNVDVDEPWFIVQNSSGVPVMIVDDEGDMYFEGLDHSLNNQNSVESFVLDNAHFNVVTSKFNSFIQDMSILPTPINSLIFNSSDSDVVAQIDEDGSIYTKGQGAYSGSQAGCLEDGYYCSGDILEDRDYYCSMFASLSGFCTYSVLSSENCLDRLSTDTESGIDENIAGIVTDYVGCTDGDCESVEYADVCTDSVSLTEYFDVGTSYSSQSIDCSDDNYYFCGGTNSLNRYLRMYGCGGGACGFDRDAFIQTCNNAGSSSYESWSCNSYTSRSRIRTDYSNTCSLGTCGVNSVDVLETESAPSGKYCSSGNWISITYSWDIGSWSSCSVSCGGGTSTRSAVCRRGYDNAVVSNSYCGSVPTTSQSCNTQSCCIPRTCSDIELFPFANVVTNPNCGTFSDGCGGTMSCGTCTGGAACDPVGLCCTWVGPFSGNNGEYAWNIPGGWFCISDMIG